MASRGIQRFGTLIVDGIRFTKSGEGLTLPEGFEMPPADPAEISELVETYLLQLPGSGPGTMLTMDAQGDLVWVAVPTTP